MTISRCQSGNDGDLGASNLDDGDLGASDLEDDGVLGASNLENGVLGASNLDDDGVLGASNLDDDGFLGASNLDDLGQMVSWWTSLERIGLMSAAEEKDDRFGRVVGPNDRLPTYPQWESSPFVVRNLLEIPLAFVGIPLTMLGILLAFVGEIGLTFYCRG